MDNTQLKTPADQHHLCVDPREWVCGEVLRLPDAQQMAQQSRVVQKRIPISYSKCVHLEHLER